MKKVPTWFALFIGAVSLAWAMLGEAPGELKTIAVTPPPIRTATPTRTAQNMALCQDALQRRSAYLPYLQRVYPATQAASMISADSANLDGIVNDLLKRNAFEEARDFMAIRDLTAAVERYCGQ